MDLRLLSVLSRRKLEEIAAWMDEFAGVAREMFTDAVVNRSRGAIADPKW